MSGITAALVKELRERTGVGMSKCKDALVRANGDIEKAIEILRKEGMASAVKKEGRETKEGIIDFFEGDNDLALLEVNCETDFVAKNERFASFTKNLAMQIAGEKPASTSDLLSKKYLGDETVTVEEFKNILIQEIGENIQVKRLEVIEKGENASYGIYSHMGGKIVTVVEITGAADAQDLAKDVAMHVAAEAPEYLTKEQVPSDVIEKEKEIAKSQVKNKPENIIDKIVEGKLNAFFDGICLINQKFVKDTSLSIAQFIEREGVSRKAKLQVTRFWYWKIGQ